MAVSCILKAPATGSAGRYPYITQYEAFRFTSSTVSSTILNGALPATERANLEERRGRGRIRDGEEEEEGV